MKSFMRRRAWLVLALAILAVGCDSPFAPEDVRIRVRNAGAEVLEDIVVIFPTQTEEYGDIDPGAATSYRTVEEAYRYAYVEAVSGDRTLVLQPIDYVGEELLEPGDYTYEIEPGTDDRLQLRLVRE